MTPKDGTTWKEGMISDLNLDTPYGALRVQWSAPPRIYLDMEPDDPGREDPLAVTPEPIIELNGEPISMERMKAILEEMRETWENRAKPPGGDQ